MKRCTNLFTVLVTVMLLGLTQSSLWACATCFGAADSKLTHGLNWGIGSLLFVILMVLGGIASFFVYLIRRSANLPGSSNETGLTEATGKIQ